MTGRAATTGFPSPVRIGQAVAIAMVIAGTILALRAGERPQSEAPVADPSGTEAALGATLDRCRFAGAAASADATCQAAWAESRDRFFSAADRDGRL